MYVYIFIYTHVHILFTSVHSRLHYALKCSHYNDLKQLGGEDSSIPKDKGLTGATASLFSRAITKSVDGSYPLED